MQHETAEIEQHAEGPVARGIEKQTAKIPSDVFLWTAGATLAGALGLHLCGRKQDSGFVAQWAPVLLVLGLYNKLVKVHGHDRLHEDGVSPERESPELRERNEAAL